MHEFFSVQCADGTYWCDNFKCSRQVASNARQSSAKRSLHSLNYKIDDFMQFSLCELMKLKMRVSFEHEIDR